MIRLRYWFVAVFILAGSGLTAFADQKSQAIKLPDCDFWIGVVWQGQIEPMGRCLKGKWLDPDIELIKKDLKEAQSISIPATWAKAENPPPLQWRVICIEGKNQQVSIAKVSMKKDAIFLKPQTPIQGTGCAAVTDHLELIFPPGKAPADAPHDFAMELNIADQNIVLSRQGLEDGISITLTNDKTGEKIFEAGEMYGL